MPATADTDVSRDVSVRDEGRKKRVSSTRYSAVFGGNTGGRRI